MSQARILIIDDEPDILEVLKGVLANLPYLQATYVSNGEEGISAIKNSKFDLLITDLAMPKMNGFEFLRRLRVLGFHIPTIVLTGHGDLTIVPQLKNYNVQAFISKPWDNGDLIQTIENLLQQRQAA